MRKILPLIFMLIATPAIADSGFSYVPPINSATVSNVLTNDGNVNLWTADPSLTTLTAGYSKDCGGNSTTVSSSAGSFSFNNCVFSNLFTASGTGISHRIFQGDTFANGLTIGASGFADSKSSFHLGTTTVGAGAQALFIVDTFGDGTTIGSGRLVNQGTSNVENSNFWAKTATGTYLVDSSAAGSHLSMVQSLVQQTGSGGAINISNGASVYNPNMLSGVFISTKDTSKYAIYCGTSYSSISNILYSGVIDPGCVTYGLGTADINKTIIGSLTLATSYTPSASSSTCTKGMLTWDASYVYVCTATNTWKRSALATW